MVPRGGTARAPKNSGENRFWRHREGHFDLLKWLPLTANGGDTLAFEFSSIMIVILRVSPCYSQRGAFGGGSILPAV